MLSEIKNRIKYLERRDEIQIEKLTELLKNAELYIESLEHQLLSEIDNKSSSK